MLETISNLKKKLSTYRADELLTMIASNFIYTPDDNKSIHQRVNLDSPIKQLPYLAGLLMSTDYQPSEKNNHSTDYSEDDIQLFTDEVNKLYSDIGEITHMYLDNFMPNEGKELSEDEKLRRMAMLPVFFDYFSQSTLVHEGQIIERIERWFKRFDEELSSEYGINSSELTQLFYSCRDILQNRVDKLQSLNEQMNEMMENLYSNPNGMSTSEREAFAIEYQNTMALQFCITENEIEEIIGSSKTELILKHFSLTREQNDYLYYTQDNEVLRKPFLKIDETRYIVLSTRVMIDAFYTWIYESLEKLDKSKKVSFYRIRGELVEEEVEKSFRKIMPRTAKFYQSVCEVPKNDEHDLLIECEKDLLIIEIKSSKTKEPRRNPDQGFDYMKTHFNSKKGIGGGYSQAVKLYKKIMESDTTILYNNKTEPFTIRKGDYDRIHLLVVTSEQFGSLNVNTSYLLNKEEHLDYPWTCDLYNLENLIDGFIYKEKNYKDLLDYFTQRVDFHKKFNTSDELDIAEYYLEEGDFKSNSEFDMASSIGFIPNVTSLFDKIYFDKIGIPYEHDCYEINTIIIKSKDFNRKIGRNETCPCGSGKKYKKCHGR